MECNFERSSRHAQYVGDSNTILLGTCDVHSHEHEQMISAISLLYE